MKRRCFVHAGEVVVTSEDCLLSTVLGPCIAVTVFDRQAGVAGLTHFALPHPSDAPENPLRYGSIAIPFLLREMIRAGAVLARFEARIFGGASMHGVPPERSIGAFNATLASEELAKVHLIPRERHVLGTRPRRLTLDVATGATDMTVVGARF